MLVWDFVFELRDEAEERAKTLIAARKKVRDWSGCVRVCVCVRVCFKYD